MTKKAWGKVKPGTVVELSGREWTVEKVKPKGGGRVKVTVSRGGNTASDVLKADAKVKIAEARRPDPKPKKRKPAPRTPPKPATGDPWETQQDRVEKKLDALLGARLIGEATDADAGYYVPPVDVTTVAAHLVLFHGGIPEWAEGDEAKMVDAHNRDHLAARAGNVEFPINHWHTEKRPTSKKGKK